MTQTKLRVFGYHDGVTAVNSYRLWSPLDYLNISGIAETNYLPKVPLDTLHIPIDYDPKDEKYNPTIGSINQHYEWADLVVTQKTNNFQEWVLHQAAAELHGKPFIVDIDDNIFKTEIDNKAFEKYRPRAMHELFDIQKIAGGDAEAQDYARRGYNVYPTKIGQYFVIKPKDSSESTYTLAMIQDAAAVTVTNETLARVVRQFNRNVYVLPNYIDPRYWEGVNKSTTPKTWVDVGWYGGDSHYIDLMIIKDVITWLMESCDNARFVWSGIRPDFLIELQKQYPERMVYKTWEQNVFAWPENFASMNIDVMLAPLRDSEFSRSKSNIKWMESAMLRIPVIASDVEPYQTISHGKTGFLCNNFKDWTTALKSMIKNTERRTLIGNQAYDEICAKYWLPDQIHRWVKVYEEVISRYTLAKRGIVTTTGVI